MAGVQKRATAKRDLVEHFVYSAEQAGIETAERFLQNAEVAFRDLSTHPEMGIALSLLEPRLLGLLRWQIKGFESFLVFYAPRTDGVTIVRVLHASRDWWGIFGISS
jgi:toxin ParE1/3/4